ncbi:glycerate kinase [Dyadobacter psychrotolerans]|uniref:Glycerate kinase n=1 Tax=Dyadobacter psychrotolerans TaxID=2541721 RepID=A0A4V2Z4E5_9BACT|nr:glycerate kinase [Dyadobacter psychrotolerans]TDE16278.1 glycerate kinase [Dyadobacter psychrotolerans]
MRILVAPDKFRGSLEAEEVCKAVEEGILLAYPDADVMSVPLADGGEGTTQILTKLAKGSTVTAKVRDPLGRMIDASYGLSAGGTTAYIEMAAASGLKLLDFSEYNPLLTTTFGTGQLILDAIEKGSKKIILGIGGSATTDAGIGMAAALGYRFFDKNDNLLDPIGGNLAEVFKIIPSDFVKKNQKVKITVACDVTNPLFGINGAAHVYGPQKGADSEMVEKLDNGLRHFANFANQTFGKNISEHPGAGAAGGLGAGCLWFLNAELKEGVGIVMEQANIAAHIGNSDLVITGEGKVDAQTLSGKVVKGLADLCEKADVPLAVVCGTLLISPDEIRSAGITCAVSVLNRPMDLDTAQTDAFRLVKEATFNLVRLFFSRK